MSKAQDTVKRRRSAHRFNPFRHGAPSRRSQRCVPVHRSWLLARPPASNTACILARQPSTIRATSCQRPVRRFHKQTRSPEGCKTLPTERCAVDSARIWRRLLRQSPQQQGAPIKITSIHCLHNHVHQRRRHHGRELSWDGPRECFESIERACSRLLGAQPLRHCVDVQLRVLGCHAVCSDVLRHAQTTPGGGRL